MRFLPLVIVLFWSYGPLAQTPSKLKPDPPMVCSDCEEWNAAKDPARVFGNTFSVGTKGLGAVLVTSQSGHILLDGGLTQSAALIDLHIRGSKFRTEDVKFILSSHAHFDHAGGIAALQRLSGATVVASRSGAQALERGLPTDDDPQFAFGFTITHFPPVKNVRVVKDGEVVRVGDVEVRAHLTPGHTPGSTAWTWRSCEGSTCKNIVYADSLTAIPAPGFRFTGDATHPSRIDDFRKSIATVRALPCDVFLTVHPVFNISKTCQTYANDALKRLEERIAEEKK